MPARKKNTSKRSKSKTASANKTKSKASAKKRTASASARNKKSAGKKVVKRKASGSSRKKTRKQTTTGTFPRKVGVQSGRQSGDMQGLARREGADSESVDELLEEGNAFEAGVVKGVEDAEDRQGEAVHTHEVPEDDVPEEYLDKD